MTPASRAPLAWSQNISSMGFNPLPPTAWEKKEGVGMEARRRLMTPLSLCLVESRKISFGGSSEAGEGLRISGRTLSPKALPAAQLS